MSSDLRLPPCGRDFDVFSLVIVGGQTTRQAAAEFKLSQTRVCQIVERVQTWQSEVLPAESPLPEERQLRMSKHMAAARLDHLYGEMMKAWRKSQGETKKTRNSRFGDEVTTTTISCGDPKYLLAAMRLATAQAELGVWGGLRCYADDEEDTSADATVEREKQPTGRPEARPTADHPAGDCSEKRNHQPAQAPAATSPPAPTANSANTSAALTLEQQLARRQLFAPVQTAAGPDDNRCISQVEVTPETLGLSVTDILTRQQRRAQKRARRAG